MYVPLLKGKEGEFSALEALKAKVKIAVRPLIEVPGVPFDFATEAPARSLDDHLANLAERLFKCWGDRELYIDLPWFGEDENLRDGRVAFQAVLEDCRQTGVKAIPVVSPRTSPRGIRAVADYAGQNNLGVCFRLSIDDFGDEQDIDSEIERLVREIDPVRPDSIDIIADLQDLGSQQTRAVLLARSVLSLLPALDQWRTIILAAASFPEDLSEVDAATFSNLPRLEWQLWQSLKARPGHLKRRDLVFGDYAISHPQPKELDPRTMRMSASIRYTTTDHWLVAKGRNVRQYGFDQYFDLCKKLVAHEDFLGRDFSWADKYISDCAEGTVGPGNATTWRKVGTNHHITLVTRDLARLSRDV